ncbi:MAG: hypothetical protein HOM11_12170 [Methylococcales bacterium]|jgi:LPS-assembly lipoprotein|nr:hypothetical protein [Methylococcales bacterium]MBT7443473.1 hypothetical protein [Methylococcales bacterium]
MKKVILLGVLIALQGCGFKMRGSVDQELHIPAAMKVTFVKSADPFGFLSKEMKKVLALYGIEVTDDRKLATGVLELVDERQRRRVLSVDGQSREQEFELFMEATFKLVSKNGFEIVGEETVSVERNYLFDKTDPLGKGNEEKVIQREMARNLVGRMLRIIRAKTAAMETQKAS